MKILSTCLNRQPRKLMRLAGYGVTFFCVLLLSTHIVYAAGMPFPEKATASITSIDATSGVITAKDSGTGQVFQFKLTNPMLLRSLNVGQAFFVDIANKLVSFDGSRINGNIVSIGPVEAGKPLGPVDGVKPAGPVDGAKPAGPVDGLKPGSQKGPAFGPIDSAKSGQTGGGTNFGPIDSAKPVGPVDGAHPSSVIDGGVATCTITSIDNSRGLITARDNQTGRSFQFRLANAGLIQALKPGQAVSANFESHQVSLTLNGQLATGSIVSAMQPTTHK